MQYAKVQEGKITQGPTSKIHIEGKSGAEKMPLEEKIENGWLPVEGNHYSRATHKQGEYEIQPEKVVHTPVAKTLEEVKAERVNIFKPLAGKEIADTDWKIMRHKDQLDLVQITRLNKTTLDIPEFEALLVKRQELREKSDTKEAEVMNATTVEEVLAVKWNDEEPTI